MHWYTVLHNEDMIKLVSLNSNNIQTMKIHYLVPRIQNSKFVVFCGAMIEMFYPVLA